jgi:adenosylcobinamide-phosphate synthase
MGHVIAFGRDLAMRLSSPRAQLIAGAVLAWLIPSGFAFATWYVLRLTAPFTSPWRWLHVMISVFLLKSSFALKELGAAAQRVANALNNGELPQGRYHLRSLCSRDASQLDSAQLVSATVASIAENISDSFIAPVIFFAVFGIPGAIFYRAVNTLDAMIGYHGKFEYLGKVAARTDDVLNYLPARLSAGLLLIARGICGQGRRESMTRGLTIMQRDHALTASPNGGWPMAAMAGLLHIEISKVGHYTLGEAREPLTTDKIAQAWQLALIAALLLSVLVILWKGFPHVFH